jgi:hypothetical protein
MNTTDMTPEDKATLKVLVDHFLTNTEREDLVETYGEEEVARIEQIQKDLQ